jgi:hypothetical protein
MYVQNEASSAWAIRVKLFQPIIHKTSKHTVLKSPGSGFWPPGVNGAVQVWTWVGPHEVPLKLRYFFLELSVYNFRGERSPLGGSKLTLRGLKFTPKGFKVHP